ncbi:MAG: hypothetical protein JSU03_13370 [Bacteroidetes bacterium]|nr:hypothetical protein [Bacteroidota bacterium]MBS1758259.1 hypothetical protein [Bacteroidota bacterium]
MYKIIVFIRSKVLVYLTHNMALPVLRVIRKPEMFPYTMGQLLHFPQGTLGKNLADFIIKRQIKLLPYYARHDIKHILLEYDTTDEGEVCLQCFMMGNGHLSFPVVATFLYGIITMPEHWKLFRKAYCRGKASPYINNWEWFDILTEQTIVLQNIINNRNHLYE